MAAMASENALERPERVKFAAEKPPKQRETAPFRPESVENSSNSNQFRLKRLIPREKWQNVGETMECQVPRCVADHSRNRRTARGKASNQR
jgi:hypothetical protein